jgi:hypothetical protein
MWVLLLCPCSAVVLPAQHIMRPFVYKTHHQLSSFKSPEATYAELQGSMSKEGFSQFKLLSKGVPKKLQKSGLSHAFMNGMAELGSHADMTKQLHKLKTLQVNEVQFMGCTVLSKGHAAVTKV